MQFKIDENLHADTADLLRQHGHDALTVFEQGLQGHIDTAIASVCQREARAIASDDSRRRRAAARHQRAWAIELSALRVANLHLEPDLNDGVVLNIAPLYELVPWKEARKYCDELMDGKYEWSSIGKQLRQKGLVK